MCTAGVRWVPTESVGDVLSVRCAAWDWGGGVDCTWVQQVCMYRIWKNSCRFQGRSLHISISKMFPVNMSEHKSLLTCYLCVADKHVNTTFSSSSPLNWALFQKFVALFQSHDRHSQFVAVNSSKSWIGSEYTKVLRWHTTKSKGFRSSFCVGELTGSSLHVLSSVHRRVWSKYRRYSCE